MKAFRHIRRKAIWLYKKIIREKATPEYIARGWAIGMFYGCLIPFGFQLMLSIPTAFLLKGSKIGATLGTMLTNHVTIFFIYPVQCYVGNKLIGGNLSLEEARKVLDDMLRERTFQSVLALGGDIITAFFVGGALLTLIMTPVTYFVVLVTARNYQKLREAGRSKKLLKAEEQNVEPQSS